MATVRNPHLHDLCKTGGEVFTYENSIYGHLRLPTLSMSMPTTGQSSRLIAITDVLTMNALENEVPMNCEIYVGI